LGVLEPILLALKEWCTGIVQSMGYPGLTLLMFLDAANLPIPSEVIMPLGGILAAEGKMNLHLAALAGTLGSTLGSIFSYWLGAKLGKPFLLKYGKYLLVRPKEIEHGEAWFTRHGLPCTLWGRFIPLVRTFISLPAGLFKAHFPTFVLYAVLGSLPWCYLWASLGYFLGQNWEQVDKALKYVDYAVVAGLLFLIGRFVYTRLKKDREATTAA
jgi:membrane protein DedA with SNARE-associated domain